MSENEKTCHQCQRAAVYRMAVGGGILPRGLYDLCKPCAFALIMDDPKNLGISFSPDTADKDDPLYEELSEYHAECARHANEHGAEALEGLSIKVVGVGFYGAHPEADISDLNRKLQIVLNATAVGGKEWRKDRRAARAKKRK